jgi:hypothetical protein
MKTQDYIHHYRGYWLDGGKCRIRIYREDGCDPVVICSQLPDNDNTSVTNMAEYLAAEVIEEHELATPLTWIEHYPEHSGKLGKYSLVRFSSWERREVCLGGVWRCRVGSPRWLPLHPMEVQAALREEAPTRLPSNPAGLRVYSKLGFTPGTPGARARRLSYREYRG